MITKAQSGQLYQLKAHLETAGDVAFNHDNEDEPETVIVALDMIPPGFEEDRKSQPFQERGLPKKPMM